MPGKARKKVGITAASNDDGPKLRARPTQARAERNVANILQAATTLVAKHGASGVSTSSIAREAGVPVGSIYRYFDNKEAIFSALAHRQHEEKDARFSEYLPDHPEDLDTDEYVAQWVENLLDSLRELPAYEELLQLAVRLPDHGEENLASTERWVKAVRHLSIFNELDIPAEDREAFYRMFVHAGQATIEMALLSETEAEYRRYKRQMTIMLQAYIGHYKAGAIK